MMRFYAKRIAEFEKTQKAYQNISVLEGTITYEGFNLILGIAKRFNEEAKKATSFRAYKIQRKSKVRVLKSSEYYVFEPKRYLKLNIEGKDEEETRKNIDKLNRRFSRYINKAKKYPALKKKISRYPYSKKEPSPPIHPSLINIQSGNMNESFSYNVKLSETKKTVTLSMSNPSPHFYFIASSVDSNKSRMIGRPLLDLLHVKFRRIYQAGIPRFYTMFQKNIYKGV